MSSKYKTISSASIYLLCLLFSTAFILYTYQHLDTKSQQPHTILIDSIHAHNFLETGIEPNNYDYHSLFGSKDAFNFLIKNGFKVQEITKGILTHQTLNNANTLFINLVSDNLPPFLIEEISAIKSFIKKGGNLLVITDHSNCYHHVNKLEPLFKQLEIKLYKETAAEVPPHSLGPGPGWIIIDNFQNHPITKNLSTISFHAGGTIDSNGAVAFLSQNGWGDYWQTAPYGENVIKSGNRGNYGNFKRDIDERTGPLAVLLARNLGKGKVVVVCDQNAMGNLWLRFADNYKLLLNIFSWFSNDTQLKNYNLFASTKKPRILILEDLAKSKFADYGKTGKKTKISHTKYFD